MKITGVLNEENRKIVAGHLQHTAMHYSGFVMDGMMRDTDHQFRRDMQCRADFYARAARYIMSIEHEGFIALVLRREIGYWEAYWYNESFPIFHGEHLNELANDAKRFGFCLASINRVRSLNHEFVRMQANDYLQDWSTVS